MHMHNAGGSGGDDSGEDFDSSLWLPQAGSYELPWTAGPHCCTGVCAVQTPSGATVYVGIFSPPLPRLDTAAVVSVWTPCPAHDSPEYSNRVTKAMERIKASHRHTQTGCSDATVMLECVRMFNSGLLDGPTLLVSHRTRTGDSLCSCTATGVPSLFVVSRFCKEHSCVDVMRFDDRAASITTVASLPPMYPGTIRRRNNINRTSLAAQGRLVVCCHPRKDHAAAVLEAWDIGACAFKGGQPRRVSSCVLPGIPMRLRITDGLVIASCRPGLNLCVVNPREGQIMSNIRVGGQKERLHLVALSCRYLAVVRNRERHFVQCLDLFAPGIPSTADAGPVLQQAARAYNAASVSVGETAPLHVDTHFGPKNIRSAYTRQRLKGIPGADYQDLCLACPTIRGKELVVCAEVWSCATRTKVSDLPPKTRIFCAVAHTDLLLTAGYSLPELQLVDAMEGTVVARVALPLPPPPANAPRRLFKDNVSLMVSAWDRSEALIVTHDKVWKATVKDSSVAVVCCFGAGNPLFDSLFPASTDKYCYRSRVAQAALWHDAGSSSLLVA